NGANQQSANHEILHERSSGKRRGMTLPQKPRVVPGFSSAGVDHGFGSPSARGVDAEDRDRGPDQRERAETRVVERLTVDEHGQQELDGRREVLQKPEGRERQPSRRGGEAKKRDRGGG